MIQFYIDPELPYFELKLCNSTELSYRKHAHEEYSVGIVELGKSCFWYEGAILDLGPQTIIYLPPGLVHSCNPIDRNQWKYKMLYINKEWMEHFLASNSALALNLPIIRADSSGMDFARVTKMMKRLNGCASPLEKEANILAVFEQALLGQELPRELKLPMEQFQLKIVREYLQSCFTEKITLDQLERCSGINKFHLIRLFKEAFKIPPHTYQTLLRINYAKKELRRNETILEVAHKAGFYDQSHFSKTFKSYTGTTPERYQKSM